MQIERHELLAAVPGMSRQIYSFHYGPPASCGKIYIQSSLHADELPGMLVLWHLKQRLAALEASGALRRHIVLVPVANPLGLEQVLMDVPQGRFDNESRENFNRFFLDLSQQVGDEVGAKLTDDPVRNLHLIRASLKAVLARQVPTTQLQSLRLTLQTLACDADMVLDLHCDFEAVQHLYLAPDFWPQVEPLARYLGAEACFMAHEAGGQSFDECFTLFWRQMQARFAGRIQSPGFAVTVELRGVADVDHGLARRDSQALIDYLTYIGAIEGLVPQLPPLLNPPTPLAGVEPIVSLAPGLIVFCARVGDALQEGQRVAEIIDPITDRSTPVVCAHGGMLYVRSLRRMATAGMTIAHVAGVRAYRQSDLLSP
ncbi:succinylglutamate desuccinylase/aspartoacylase family protein [Pseudomonas sp. MF7448]|uniref:succinylglutamate desuccinylase/aspartoacylase family protein n=1 Tax=Pseudomonas sp. MF7448 TaxID=2797537 RepID=UPI00190AB161|nr:succinylglutamate desuccinylase/aspartoacylase family protein [Pseudomonas sp. MF7448]MBK3436073.1 succinylglutamate desuccinylase/aspartoacylase family protein [Pseudomonas sp. MF7448]